MKTRPPKGVVAPRQYQEMVAELLSLRQEIDDAQIEWVRRLTDAGVREGLIREGDLLLQRELVLEGQCCYTDIVRSATMAGTVDFSEIYQRLSTGKHRPFVRAPWRVDGGP